MITPIEIQSKTFKSGGLGYDKKDVDGFLREVLRSYETVYRENMELTDKVAMLTEGIQYYKTIEKTLQKALVLAEKTAEDTKIAAVEKAKNIEREARTRSQLIVADAKNELEHIHNQTVQLIQQYEKYKVQFKNLAAAQLELIESEPFNISIARLDSFVNTELPEDAKKASKLSDNVRMKEVEADSYDATKEFEAEEEAAASKETKRMNDEIPVEFDTSFMDSYDKGDAKSSSKDEYDYSVDDEDDDDEDEEEIKPSKKDKKKKKHDFSFFSLEDDEE